MNAAVQPEKKRGMVHLVNYDARNSTIPPLDVTWRLPQGARAKTIRLYSPDAAAPRTLEAKPAAGAVSFTVPDIRVYSIAVVEW